MTMRMTNGDSTSTDRVTRKKRGYLLNVVLTLRSRRSRVVISALPVATRETIDKRHERHEAMSIDAKRLVMFAQCTTNAENARQNGVAVRQGRALTDTSLSLPLFLTDRYLSRHIILPFAFITTLLVFDQ